MAIGNVLQLLLKLILILNSLSYSPVLEVELDSLEWLAVTNKILYYDLLLHGVGKRKNPCNVKIKNGEGVKVDTVQLTDGAHPDSTSASIKHKRSKAGPFYFLSTLKFSVSLSSLVHVCVCLCVCACRHFLDSP